MQPPLCGYEAGTKCAEAASLMQRRILKCSGLPKRCGDLFGMRPMIATDAATFMRVRSGYEMCRCGELDAETQFEMPRIAEANAKL